MVTHYILSFLLLMYASTVQINEILLIITRFCIRNTVNGLLRYYLESLNEILQKQRTNVIKKILSWYYMFCLKQRFAYASQFWHNLQKRRIRIYYLLSSYTDILNLTVPYFLSIVDVWPCIHHVRCSSYLIALLLSKKSLLLVDFIVWMPAIQSAGQ